MSKFSQFGLSVAVLGVVIALMGLFPSIIGLEATPGVGVLQILVVLVGMGLLIGGAFIFVQSTFYPHIRHNLAQQIALRLSMTGLVVSIASGLADVLGFGSHPVGLETQRPLLGPYQMAGLIAGFFIASFGVLIFVLMGDHPNDPEESGDTSQQP